MLVSIHTDNFPLSIHLFLYFFCILFKFSHALVDPSVCAAEVEDESLWCLLETCILIKLYEVSSLG